MKAIQRQRARFLSGLFFLSISFGSHVAAATVTISDSVFDDANWTMTLLDDRSFGGIGSLTGNQVLSGGNPGSYRAVTMSGGGGILFGDHLFSTAYNPSTQGAITSFSFSFDTSFPDANQTKPPAPVRFGIALFQSGKHFIRFDGGVSSTTTAWTSFGGTDIGQNDMDEYLNSTVHPDFSASGAPILFGFNVGFGSLIPCSSPCATGGLDNFSVTVNPPAVPEPATWTLMFPILTLLAGVRRSTRRQI